MNKEERLREYINKDYSYINYKTGVEEGSDFDKFCIQHCKDIEELLEENEKLKADLQLHRGALNREYKAIHRANDLEEIICKLRKRLLDLSYLNDELIDRELLDILKEVE